MSGRLVSCLMPTCNRREFITAAIDCFLSQTYEPRELLIVDDGESVEDLVPQDPKISYVRLAQKMMTGDKRNHCCGLARGEILCHWDDDDWSAPDRIAHQIGMLDQSGLPVTGYGALYFWDILKREAKLYRAQAPGYVCGTTLCFLKSYWQKNPFPGKQVASDNGFVYPAAAKKMTACSNDPNHMVARIHGNHTSAKNNIRQVVSRDLLPGLFWENEKLRLSGIAA